MADQILPQPESGIVYAIRNTLNDKCYIGSTVVPTKRKHKHFADLRAGRHHSTILQRAFIKHGETAFVFEVLEVCPVVSIRTREQHYLDSQQPEYNMSLIASQQTRLGMKNTPEHNARISASLTGLPGTNTGRKFSKATRDKMSEAAKRQTKRTGWHHSDDAKAKVGNAQRGVKDGPASAAAKRKQSRSLKQMWKDAPAEWKEARSQAISKGLGGRTFKDANCVICSTPFQFESNGKKIPKTCGTQICIRKLRAQIINSRRDPITGQTTKRVNQ